MSVALALVPAALAAPALAGDVQAEARAKGEEGLRFYALGRWAEAYDAFAKADALYHAPTLTLFMARCRIKQKKLLEGRALLQTIAGDKLPANAPDQFRKAQSDAIAELATLTSRIPSIVVSIKGEGASRATISIDGAVIRATELSAGKEVDPGEHTVVAEAPGKPAVTRKVTLVEGDVTKVELVLDAVAIDVPRGVPVPSEQRRSAAVPAAVAFGVAGAGLALGIGAGVVAMGKIKSIHDACADNGDGSWTCPVSLQSKLEADASTARALTIASGVGFGLAAAGAIAGTVVAIVVPRSGPSKSDAPPRVRLGLGAGTFVVHGAF